MKRMLSIGGMHGTACELRIENALFTLPGVKDARASYAKTSVKVVYDEALIGRAQMDRAIADAGYMVTSEAVKPKPNNGVLRIIGAMVILFGVSIAISQTVGFDLIPAVNPGISLPDVTRPAVSADAGIRKMAVADSVKDGDGVQRIATAFTSGRYAPITVKADIPVVWTISIAEADLNGCNNLMVIPAYGVEKKLVPGDNIIEFTPNESGAFGYSCWMGMIRSTITVLSPDGTASEAGQAPGLADRDNGNTLPPCCG